MGFLILSMPATINLNTSLNQHSLPSSLSSNCMPRFCFVLYGVIFVRDYVTCNIIILGTLFYGNSMKIISQKFRHLQNWLLSTQSARELQYCVRTNFWLKFHSNFNFRNKITNKKMKSSWFLSSYTWKNCTTIQFSIFDAKSLKWSFMGASTLHNRVIHKLPLKREETMGWIGLKMSHLLLIKLGILCWKSRKCSSGELHFLQI